MLFNSIEFLIFFPVVLLVYYLIPKKCRYLWLLAASYYFYMCWNARYALLILTSTVITFLSGLYLDKVNEGAGQEREKQKKRKLIVAVSFIGNLGILFYYKYFNFALNTVSNLFRLFHVQLNLPVFDIVLPVGISFYTFQALGYTMDVYRNKIRAEKNFFRYALFVSFFPQLVAGPIERSGHLLQQLENPKKFSFEDARDGFLLMLWGFFLKLVIADRAAIFVNTVYGDYRTYGGMMLIAATVLFAVQIYCDFYGYSVLAMGSAKILGVELMENFNAPYFNLSVAAFWRNWHISLTSWFKDYLYIPLGGSRKGIFRKHLNRMIVFLVSGLWHGASISFVIWGGLNGLYQVLGDVLKPVRDRLIGILHLNRQSLVHRFIQMLMTFALVDFSWIFFRANSATEGFRIVKTIMTDHSFRGFTSSLFNCGLDKANFLVLILAIAVLMAADYYKLKGIKLREVVVAQDYWFRWVFIAVAIALILTFGIWGPGYNAAGFIYFQF